MALGRSASRAERAAAACSGLHAQPLRPASVIGPSNAGVDEGCSAPDKSESIEAAPATPAAPAPMPAAKSSAQSTERSQNLDIAPSIAESLKNP
jgi:hypothetical protein